jgi:polyphosphate kinase
MADVNRIFNYLEHHKTGIHFLRACNTIIPSPYFAKREVIKLIRNEVKCAQNKKTAIITAKMNSLSDEDIIEELNTAARAGVQVNLIIRGIFCMLSESGDFVNPVKAISIIDEYLEHARVWFFHARGKEKIFISSADWMVRNLEHRVEATCPIYDERIKKELKEILTIQCNDNVKARWLNNSLSNDYVRTNEKRVRSQEETYNYLQQKTEVPIEVSSH